MANELMSDLKAIGLRDVWVNGGFVLVPDGSEIIVGVPAGMMNTTERNVEVREQIRVVMRRAGFQGGIIDIEQGDMFFELEEDETQDVFFSLEKYQTGYGDAIYWWVME